MGDTDRWYDSVMDMAGAIRNKKLSPVELMDLVLERIAALQPSLNAFITVLAEQGRAAAAAAEQAMMRGENVGPLHGIPFAVKDLTLTKGVRTTMGSPIADHLIPSEDAIPVARLKRAGAVLIGKTTTPEYGHKPFTDGPLFGRTLNPWQADVTCGGSSGGSAVAVATGMSPFALGTDGGGSIRIPAACCGIVGLKATLGAIPHIHAPDLFGNHSYIGPMTRSVGDARLVFSVLAGPSSLDPYGQGHVPIPQPLPAGSLSGITIGWMPTVGNRVVDPEVITATQGVVRTLEDMGAGIETVGFDFAALEQSFLVMLQSALHARLAAYLPAFGNRIDPSLRVTIEAGARWSAADLQQANAQRSEMFRRVQQAFDTFAFLVSPTLSAPPLPVDQDPHGEVMIANQPAGLLRGAWYPYTYPFNLTGHPAISLPCGWTTSGLPVGVQIVGPWHSETRMLDLASRLEAAQLWQRRHPPM